MEENELIKKENQPMNNAQPNKTNTGLIACLIIIIILLAGALVYFVFLKKEDKTVPLSPTENTEKEENKEDNEKDNTNKEETDNKVDENVYKTANGKHTLNVKDYSKETITYDGKKYRAYEKIQNGKYIVYEADDVGNSSQCGMYSFIVNSETHTLLDFDYKKAKFSVNKIDDKYYFHETDSCVFGPNSYYGIYAEDMKKLGESYFGKDANNNFYVYSDKTIIKYDKNANVIKKVSANYELNNIMIGEATSDAIITKDNLYFIYKEGGNESSDKYYLLVDTMNEKEYKLAKVADYDVERASIDEAGQNIQLPFTESCPMDNNCSNKQIAYTFNIKTGELTQK